MLADFYIPRLSNDMKLTVQKNHLGGQIFYRIPNPPKIRYYTRAMNFSWLKCFVQIPPKTAAADVLKNILA